MPVDRSNTTVRCDFCLLDSSGNERMNIWLVSLFTDFYRPRLSIGEQSLDSRPDHSAGSSRDHVFLLQNIRRFNKWQNWERIDLYNIMHVHIAFGENKQTEFFFCCWGLVFARNLEELSLGIQTIETESCQEKYCLTVGRRIMIAHWNCITKKSQITRDSPAEIKLALLSVLVCLSHGIYIHGSFACIYNSDFGT